MEVHYFPYSLVFKYVFNLSHTSRTHTDNVYLLLEEDDFKAWGETVFIPYYPEDLNSFQELLATIDIPAVASLVELKTFIQQLSLDFPQHSFSIAAIDMAMHQLLALKEQKSVASLYGINGIPPPTSFTLGISDKAQMKEKIEDNPDVGYYKLKVSEELIAQIIENYVSLNNKAFVVDANQGFEDKEKALYWCEQLHNMGVPYLEQPFKKEDFEKTRWLKERSPIPIIADEAFQNIDDLEKVAEAYDGINIKLMKCGGIANAYEIFQKATTMGLKTVLGCMSESTVGTNAAYHLAPLANWVDLDGPLLISNDLFDEAADLSDAERIEMLKRIQE